jgi:hypothetical protein
MSFQTSSAGILRSQMRLAIAFIVVVIVFIIVVAGAAAIYVFFLSPPDPSGTHPTTTVTTTTTTSVAGGVKNYAGTFTYINPIGPTGVRLNSDNTTVSTYGTILNASGSFTFSVADFNRTGTGTGKGTMIATTTGYCTGRTTFDYTFPISNANTVGPWRKRNRLLRRCHSCERNAQPYMHGWLRPYVPNQRFLPISQRLP